MTVADHDLESQVTRRRVLENDARLREQQQGTTLSQFAQAEANEVGGRFSGHERATVIGVTPSSYPKGPDWTVDPCGPEPSLGIDINFVEPCGTPAEIEASLVNQFPEPSFPAAQTTDGPADAPLGGNGSPAAPCGGLVPEPAGSSPFQTESEIEEADDVA